MAAMCSDTAVSICANTSNLDGDRAATLTSAIKSHTSSAGGSNLNGDESSITEKSLLPSKKDKETMKRSHSANECKRRPGSCSTKTVEALSVTMMELGVADVAE